MSIAKLQPVGFSYSLLWVAVRAGLRRVLDGTSLEQLLTGDLPADVRSLAEDPEAGQNR